jgi:hypothetical protein
MNKYCHFKKGERKWESQVEEYDLEKIKLPSLRSLRKTLAFFA